MATERQESRTQVKTYVPADQKERWRDQAERLDMTLSEFVRTMVQAGRRDFEVPSDPATGEAGSPSAERDTPGVEVLEDRILDVLRPGDAVAPDDLVAAVTDELESQVYDTLDELDDAGRVTFDPRAGGYTIADDGE